MSQRDEIARHMFRKAMTGHAQWENMTEPNKDDWRAMADAILALLEPDDAMVEAALDASASAPPNAKASMRAALSAALRAAKGE